MSASKRRKEALRRRHRRTLNELFSQGKVLVWSGAVPGRPDVRQTVGLELSSTGHALVTVEHYYPTEWDSTIEERELSFPDFDKAVSWLESNCGVDWTELHESGSAGPHRRNDPSKG
jgi:hypothetical protein